MITRLRSFFRSINHSSYLDPKTQRHFYEGGVAPDSLLNRKPGDPPLGAMIAVDPETKIITKIFFS